MTNPVADIKLEGFRFEVSSGYLTLSYETSGYYGCDSEYNLDLKETEQLRDFLDDCVEELKESERIREINSWRS